MDVTDLSMTADARGTTTIESVETYALRVPLRKPMADATWVRPTWTVPVVEIRTSDGLVGTGCSGVHAGEELLCLAIMNYHAPEILGRDPRDIRALWQDLYWSDVHWVGRGGVVHMAQSMVDIALWDLAAQRAGLPLWRLLGGHHSALHSYNTDGGWLNRTVEELIDEMGDLRAQGWDRLKMKIGKPDWREDVKRMRAVREALGDDVTLMCDVNQGWDLKAAMRMLPYLEEVEMDWIEEPLHPDDVEGHARLQAETRIPIAVGESLYSRQSFAQFINAGALGVAQVDVTRVAGVTEWLQVAADAAAHGLWVIPHAGDMMQVHQHLVASTFARKPATIEYIPWTLEVYEEPCRVERGIVQLPEIPGASTRVRPDARSRWAIEGIGGEVST
jgi:L-alanine-DL-glutamate epimerase-like enolase superfamily enzyme